MTEVAVHDEDLLGLTACAFARERFPELGFEDPLAEEILGDLTHQHDAFDERRLRSAVVRTMVVDALVHDFFSRHPAGVAVSLAPGLCTRFSRLDNGLLQWLELETAEVAAFKRDLFPTRERHVIAQCCSVACHGWMRSLGRASDVPTLLVAQGGFRRSPFDLRDAFFTNAAQHLPAGTELVIDYDADAPLRPTSPARGAALAVRDPHGTWASYPRLRFVRDHEPRLAHDLAGVNAVSRLFCGRGMPSVAHLYFT